MQFTSGIDGVLRQESDEAALAEQYAAMIDEIYVDRDDLDAELCPPDRRFFLADKEAWVYEHGNICELVYVRVNDEGEL